MTFLVKVYQAAPTVGKNLKSTEDFLSALSTLDELPTKMIEVEAGYAWIRDGCLVLSDNETGNNLVMAFAKDTWLGVVRKPTP